MDKTNTISGNLSRIFIDLDIRGVRYLVCKPLERLAGRRAFIKDLLKSSFRISDFSSKMHVFDRNGITGLFPLQIYGKRIDEFELTSANDGTAVFVKDLRTGRDVLKIYVDKAHDVREYVGDRLASVRKSISRTRKRLRRLEADAETMLSVTAKYGQ